MTNTNISKAIYEKHFSLLGNEMLKINQLLRVLIRMTSCASCTSPYHHPPHIYYSVLYEVQSHAGRLVLRPSGQTRKQPLTIGLCSRLEVSKPHCVVYKLRYTNSAVVYYLITSFNYYGWIHYRTGLKYNVNYRVSLDCQSHSGII